MKRESIIISIITLLLCCYLMPSYAAETVVLEFQPGKTYVIRNNSEENINMTNGNTRDEWTHASNRLDYIVYFNNSDIDIYARDMIYAYDKIGMHAFTFRGNETTVLSIHPDAKDSRKLVISKEGYQKIEIEEKEYEELFYTLSMKPGNTYEISNRSDSNISYSSYNTRDERNDPENGLDYISFDEDNNIIDTVFDWFYVDSSRFNPNRTYLISIHRNSNNARELSMPIEVFNMLDVKELPSYVELFEEILIEPGETSELVNSFDTAIDLYNQNTKEEIADEANEHLYSILDSSGEIRIEEHKKFFNYSSNEYTLNPGEKITWNVDQGATNALKLLRITDEVLLYEITSSKYVDFSGIYIGITEQEAKTYVDKELSRLDKDSLSSADTIEDVTKLIEKSISSVASVNVYDSTITINSTLLNGVNTKANNIEQEMKTILSNRNIELNREIQSSVLVNTSFDENGLDIQLESSLNNLVSSNITIFAGELAITVPEKVISEDLSSTLKVFIEKTDDSSLVGNDLVDAVASMNYIYTDNIGIIAGNTVDGDDVYRVNFEKNGQKVDETDQKLVISFESTGNETDYDAVFINREDGSIPEAIGGNYDKSSNMINIQTNESGTYYVKENRKNFTDILGLDEVTKKAIEVLAAKGMINGKSDSIFDPGGTISRAEFTKIIIRALYLTDWNVPNTFSDVPENAWYKPYVASSKKEGLINGYNDGTFRPGNIISKQEMIKICSASLHEQKGYYYPSDTGQYLNIYSDDIADWVKQYLALAEREGIVVNSTTGVFKGADGTTRADAAVMLYRLFKRL